MTTTLINPAVSERPANLEAQRLTRRTYVSHSQLSTFRGCSRKFAFLYIENAPREFHASSLLFGSAMHAAFEFHFRRRLEGVITSGGDTCDPLLDPDSPTES